MEIRMTPMELETLERWAKIGKRMSKKINSARMLPGMEIMVENENNRKNHKLLGLLWKEEKL